MTSDDLVNRLCPTIGDLGAAFYFTPETMERGKEVGLDGLRFYFLGRGGVLGDVEPRVIQSAFGYFEAAMVEKMWSSARERCGVSPRDAGRAYVEASRAFGRARFGAVDGLGGFCAAAEQVIAGTDPAGLALYAGLSAEPLPDDLPGRAMQLLTVLRELRGSIHLLAVVAAGISPLVAHYFRRPGDFALFGYSEEQVPVLTDADRTALEQADAHTDRLMAAAFSGLEPEAADALAAGVEAMAAALRAA